jgi:uncharacterized protein YdiU (UPF0061 family)
MTIRFSQLALHNDYRSLPPAFYRDVMPAPLSDPALVVVSTDCAHTLGIDPDSLSGDDALAILAGQRLPETWRPLAMKYDGHQFGYYNPDLGDGRGLLLGEQPDPRGRLWDLHLKGAGPTPFARQGDGRAVLRSSIREFLGSEAMHALGIRSTRALCVVHTETPVLREQMERAATLLRCTPSHIRFGHFEFAARTGQPELLERLARHVLRRHYPCLLDTPNQYADLFRLIAQDTARMIADWQLVGFNHGVMNSDNMSILGETFDYGPFAFLDHFEPHHVCNHSDQQGRYAFDRQPAIGHWNLAVLARAMASLVSEDALRAGMTDYGDTFNQHFMRGMRGKLGLHRELDSDGTLILDCLTMLASGRLDYTLFFRLLGDWQCNPEHTHALRDHTVDIGTFDRWFEQYRQRLQHETCPPEQRQAAMQARNPLYILRKHLAQIAIAQAEQGDYSEVRRLHQVLCQPFTEQADRARYAELPPDWAAGLELSCSS